MESKKTYLSKSVWLGLVVGIAGFFPYASGWIAANPELVSHGLGALIIVLRVVTEKKLELPFLKK